MRCNVEPCENIFYSDTIRKDPPSVDRDRVSSWEPCCIVASSGMLNGGRSSGYAKHLASDSANLIAITGYQAKGSPGRKLLDLPNRGESSTERMWSPDGETSVGVECPVKRYSLSAHVDEDELRELVQKVQPRRLFLVHGDKDPQEGLYQSVRESSPNMDVQLPINDGTYPVAEKRAGIAKGVLPTLGIEGRVRIAEQLIQIERCTGRTHELPERLELLSETESEAEEEDTELLEDLWMQARESLADEEPSQSVLPCRPGRVDQHGTYPARCVVLPREVAGSQAVGFVDDDEGVEALIFFVEIFSGLRKPVE